MQIKVDEEKEKTRVQITGNIDIPAAEILKKNLLQVAQDGTKEMVLDFQEVDSICSSGIGALILFHEKLKNQGGLIKIVHLNEQIRSLFKIIKLNNLFEISES